MGFNEKVHAFIAARYFVRLTEQFGKRGENAFIHATQYYAEQRGRRMGQRAIRDGRELDYGTYEEYSEWVNTEDVIKEGCANEGEVLSVNPDYVLKITACPWHAQFKEMGLTEAGIIYCRHLDNSICRGFNPYLQYEVTKTLHTSDCCLHIIRDVKLGEDEVHEPKTEYLKSFEYHCAHIFWSFAEVAESIFNAGGKKLAEDVLDDFRSQYGDPMAETLLKYCGKNFNICD